MTNGSFSSEHLPWDHLQPTVGLGLQKFLLCSPAMFHMGTVLALIHGPGWEYQAFPLTKLEGTFCFPWLLPHLSSFSALPEEKGQALGWECRKVADEAKCLFPNGWDWQWEK